MTTHQDDHPYVGPVPFTTEQAGMFHGRVTETKILLSRVITERVVLFHAMSGAGKSSLINARIIPGLIEREFLVLPLVRIGLEMPLEIKLKEEIKNVFAFNTFRSLGIETAEFDTFKTKTLKEGLFNLLSKEKLEKPHWVIFDQFEEIFTSNPERWKDREEFFKQLQEILDADPKLSIIFVIREDFVARLDRYAQLLNGQLRIRFNMELLTEKSAIEAIKLPAENAGKPFEDGVAESLEKNLSRLKSVEGTLYQGEFVEPVYLQVVCLQLWEKVKTKGKSTITMEDLDQFGNPDEALKSFYSEAVKKISSDPEVLKSFQESSPIKIEALIRQWFQEKLITQNENRDIRAQAGAESLRPEVLSRLLSEHLIRREEARGGEWYELAHDRFVEPVKVSNLEWFNQNQHHPSLDRAKEWDNNKRDSKYLLEGKLLKDANDWYKENINLLLSRDDREILGQFLKKSNESQEAKEKKLAEDREKQRRKRQALISVLSGISISLAIISLYFAFDARSKKDEIEKVNKELNKVNEKLNKVNEKLKKVNEDLEDRGCELIGVNGQLEAKTYELTKVNENLNTKGEELATANKNLIVKSDELTKVNKDLNFTNNKLNEKNIEAETAKADLECVNLQLKKKSVDLEAKNMEINTRKNVEETRAKALNIQDELDKPETLRDDDKRRTKIKESIQVKLDKEKAQVLEDGVDIITKEEISLLEKALPLAHIKYSLAAGLPVECIQFVQSGSSIAATGHIWKNQNKETMEETFQNALKVWTISDKSGSPNLLKFTLKPNERPNKQKEVTKFEESEKTCVTISPNGQRFAIGTKKGFVNSWEINLNDNSAKQLYFDKTHIHEVNKLEFRSDGLILATSSLSPSWAIIDEKNKSHGPSLWKRIGYYVSGHSPNRQQTAIAFGNYSSNQHKVELIARARVDGKVELVDVKERTKILRLPKHHSGIINSLVFSNDGTLLFSAGQDNRVVVWDIAKLDLDGKFHHQKEEENDDVEDKKIKDKGIVCEFSGHTGPILSIAINEKQNLIATASQDRTVIIWDISNLRDQTKLKECRTPTPIITLIAHDSQVNAVAFSENGELLATGGLDATAKIWNIESRCHLKKLAELLEKLQCFKIKDKSITEFRDNGYAKVDETMSQSLKEIIEIINSSIGTNQGESITKIERSSIPPPPPPVSALPSATRRKVP